SSKDTVRKREASSSWGGSVSYSPFMGIFSVGGNASGSHYSLDQSEGGADVSISAYGFGQVTIRPAGGWYAPELIRWFKANKGTFLPNAPLTADQSLWGKDGVLSLQPVQLLVMVRPTLHA